MQGGEDVVKKVLDGCAHAFEIALGRFREVGAVLRTADSDALIAEPCGETGRSKIY